MQQPATPMATVQPVNPASQQRPTEPPPQPPKKQYYFVNRDSFVKEDTDIDVGYYIHKQKLGEGSFSLISL